MEPKLAVEPAEGATEKKNQAAESSIKSQQSSMNVVIMRDNTIFHQYISVTMADYFYKVHNITLNIHCSFL